MSNVVFAQTVLRLLDVEIGTMIVRLADGVPQDWPAYRAMCGELRGLRRAREVVTDRFSDDDRMSFQLD